MNSEIKKINEVETAETSPRVVRCVPGWSALDSAVVVQLGYNAPTVDGDRILIEEEVAQMLADVSRCSCGAAGGFPGFIYYWDTWEFFVAMRADIRAALHEFADGTGCGGALDMICDSMRAHGFKPSADDVGRVLWGELPEKWGEYRNERGEIVSGGAEFDAWNAANWCAFFALENTASKWSDGEEVND